MIEYKETNAKKILEKIKLTFPYDDRFLELLKKSNKNKQEYYYIEEDEKFAFFILYELKFNVFAYSIFKCNMSIKIIGLPCSLSYNGFVTNDIGFLFDYIKKIKGIKLILNVDEEYKIKHFTCGETLPTMILKNRFNSIDDYMEKLRSGYRRRLNIAIKDCESKGIICKKNNEENVYNLYLNTYNKSNYKLEKLEKNFFDEANAEKIVFYKNNNICSFVLLKIVNNKLVFMFCGMEYNFDNKNLYYYMLYIITKYGIENKVEYIDFGQTTEETKMKMGAKAYKKFFYINSSNFILNIIIKLLKNILQYKYKFKTFNVFKDENEDIISKTLLF